MKFTPFRITLIYFVFAILWIFATDLITEYVLAREVFIIQFELLKGSFFVAITAIFLYWLLIKFEHSQKREQELQSKILSSIPVMITVYRPSLSDFSVNKEFEKVVGWTDEEINKVNIFAEIYPDKEQQEEVREFMKSPDGKWKDLEMVTKDGQRIQSTWTNLRLSDDTQIGIGLNITERKKIEKQLRKNEEWLQLTTTSSNIGLWEWHPQTGTTIFDEVWANLVGYTLEELKPVSIDTWYELLHPVDVDKFHREMDRYFSGEKPIYECEIRMKHKNGDWVWILDRGKAVEWDDNGDPTRLVGTHVNITHQKIIEEQIDEERNRFEIAANLTSDVIWEWRAYNKQLWWGEGIETVFGYEKDQYERDPKFWQKHIAEYDRQRVVKTMEEAEKSGAKEWNEEYDFIAADGSVKKIKDTAVILRNEEGDIVRIIGAMVDKTKEIEYREALHHQSYRFEMIAKSSNDVLYEWNLETGDVWWSEGWHTRFGYETDEVESTFEWWLGQLHPEDKDKILDTIEKAKTSANDYWSGHYRMKDGLGNYINVVDRGYFLKDDHGRNKFMVGTISDITADVKAKEELKASEEQYRLLFDQNPVPMFIYEPDTLKFNRVNKAALNTYGYTEEEMLRMSVLDIRPKSEVEWARKIIDKNKKKDFTSFVEATHQTKSGDKLTVEISSSSIEYRGKKQRLAIAHDITNQRKAEEKAISAIIEGEERERQRIAKELHDGLGQYLSASNMNLKSVYEDLENIPESLDVTFQTGLDFLNHAISETRNISQNLLPKAIQDYGLELAAESLINHLSKTHKIKFHFYTNLGDVEISDKKQINLYRILQEALNNAIKHGETDKIDVQLVHSNDEILMTVEDNGIGFDTEEIEHNGLGIRSMKTRVGAMSANLDIVSNKGRGTIISVIVPVH